MERPNRSFVRHWAVAVARCDCRVSIGYLSLWASCQDAADVKEVLVGELAGRIDRKAAEVAVWGQLAAWFTSTMKTDLLVSILLRRRR